MTVFTWSTTAASNANADATINWAENQAPSTVNDSARAMMAALAKWYSDLSGNLVTGGSSTAYTASSGQGFTSLVDGLNVSIRLHTTNGASPTLNVDSLGAKAIRVYTSTAVPTGVLLGGSVHRFTYDSTDDCFYLHGYLPAASLEASGIKMLFVQTSAPTGWTKDTTHNDKALRVVSGTAASGGTVAFETAFASQSVAGTVGSTALTENQIPSHYHFVLANVQVSSTSPPSSSEFVAYFNNLGTDTQLSGTGTTASVGRSSSTGGGQSHTHTFTGTAIDLDVQYVDVIIATKN